MTYVFRFDTRPPAEIFATGFVARGNNLNLNDHWLGVPVATSGFISTASTYRAALYFTEEFFQRTGQRQGYIYTVAANQNFYDPLLTYETLLQRMRDAGVYYSYPRFTSAVREGLAAYGWEREWITDHPIASSMISWAMPITGSSSGDGRLRLQEGEIESNAQFMPSNTFANTSPYPMQWPPADFPDSSSSSCSGDSDSDGSPAGSECAGDLFGAGGSAGGYIHPGLLPDCASSSRMKRDVNQPACLWLTPLVNISKLRRVLIVLSSIDAAPNPQARPRRDEL